MPDSFPLELLEAFLLELELVFPAELLVAFWLELEAVWTVELLVAFWLELEAVWTVELLVAFWLELEAVWTVELLVAFWLELDAVWMLELLDVAFSLELEAATLELLAATAVNAILETSLTMNSFVEPSFIVTRRTRVWPAFAKTAKKAIRNKQITQFFLFIFFPINVF